MPAPDPESFGLLEKVVAAATAIVVPIWGVRTWLEKRMDRKADKHTVNNQIQVLQLDVTGVKQVQAKIFDQIRENEQRAQDRHERLMEAIRK